MQAKPITISMTVSSLLVNQGDSLTDEELRIIVTNFLTTQLYFPIYSAQGETNNKEFDIQLIFDKKSPVLNELNL